jgi:hypothetical protein
MSGDLAKQTTYQLEEKRFWLAVRELKHFTHAHRVRITTCCDSMWCNSYVRKFTLLLF